MLYGVPVKFISIDAQTGDIQQYGLDKIPSWVDRVYSKATAKTMLEWWGHWGAGPQNAPYQPFYEGNNNRYKVSGDLNLVYTDEGPAWQALMTSYASDTAVQFVALMDTRSNYVRMYPAPEGIQIESHIVDAINSSGNNLKGLDPTHLVMHKVFGQLVWVGSLVAKGAGGATDGKFPQAQSFQGVSLLTSTSADAAKVIIGTSKGDALGKLSQQIASGSNNANPNAGGLNKTVQGTVAAATIITETGNSTVLIRLVGDKDNVYSGPVTTNDAKTLQRAVAKAGDKVTITYLDTGSPIRNIASYTTTAEAVPVG